MTSEEKDDEIYLCKNGITDDFLENCTKFKIGEDQQTLDGLTEQEKGLMLKAAHLENTKDYLAACVYYALCLKIFQVTKKTSNKYNSSKICNRLLDVCT